jgi:alpha-D-xyloside xylohydrolase
VSVASPESALPPGQRPGGGQHLPVASRGGHLGGAAARRSGDIPSTFEALPKQVRAGLNAGLSVIPWWTTDIGGFHGGNIETPYFRELIVRWFQCGVVSDIFRVSVVILGRGVVYAFL